MEQDPQGPVQGPEGGAAKEAKAVDGWAEIAPAPAHRATAFVPAAGTEWLMPRARRATREVAPNVGPRWRANRTATGRFSEEIVESVS